MDKACGRKSRGKTVSKLRSAPRPYLAQAPPPKLGVGIDLTEGRTVSHRDGGSKSVRCAADFKLLVGTADLTILVMDTESLNEA